MWTGVAVRKGNQQGGAHGAIGYQISEIFEINDDNLLITCFGELPSRYPLLRPILSVVDSLSLISHKRYLPVTPNNIYVVLPARDISFPITPNNMCGEDDAEPKKSDSATHRQLVCLQSYG